MVRKCSNDSDRKTKKRKKSSRRSTRRSPRLLEKEQVALGIHVLLQTDLLPWRDAISLGSTCKTAQETWMMTRDVHMLPLFNVLEKMFGHDEEDDKGSLRDFILDEDYDNFSIADKCKDLAVSIGFMVFNFQCYPGFCLDDPSNRQENMESSLILMECDPGHWGLERDDFLHTFHRRGTLAFNIAIFAFAVGALERGGDCDFNDVFMEDFETMANVYIGRSSYYWNVINEDTASMFPYRDKDLAKYMRSRLYPSASVLELLGPKLTKRIVLAEPFFRFLPPSSDDDEVNSAPGNYEEEFAPLFQHLPTPLESITG